MIIRLTHITIKLAHIATELVHILTSRLKVLTSASERLMTMYVAPTSTTIATLIPSEGTYIRFCLLVFSTPNTADFALFASCTLFTNRPYFALAALTYILTWFSVFIQQELPVTRPF